MFNRGVLIVSRVFSVRADFYDPLPNFSPGVPPNIIGPLPVLPRDSGFLKDWKLLRGLSLRGLELLLRLLLYLSLRLSSSRSCFLFLFSSLLDLDLCLAKLVYRAIWYLLLLLECFLCLESFLWPIFEWFFAKFCIFGGFWVGVKSEWKWNFMGSKINKNYFYWMNWFKNWS